MTTLTGRVYGMSRRYMPWEGWDQILVQQCELLGARGEASGLWW